MSYTFNPWRSLWPMLRDARRLRREGYRKAATQTLEAVAENRRRWLATGSFHPIYPRKENR